jgi:aminopeptidase N
VKYFLIIKQEGTKREFTFDGIVEITLRATKPGVNQIVLHAFDLEISSYAFGVFPSQSYNASNYNEQYNKWTIPIPSTYYNGILPEAFETVLKVEYVGFMRDDMYGFYRSYYVENGVKVWMATTQFQPDHARRAFPCFDVSNWKLS